MQAEPIRIEKTNVSSSVAMTCWTFSVWKLSGISVHLHLVGHLGTKLSYVGPTG